jgi:hypothetical protein
MTVEARQYDWKTQEFLTFQIFHNVAVMMVELSFVAVVFGSSGIVQRSRKKGGRLASGAPHCEKDLDVV